MKLNPFAMLTKEFDNQGIVFDPENNTAMALNTTGVVIWEALSEGLDEAQVVERIIEKFAVEPPVAAEDVAAFIALLKSKGLLTD